MIDHDFLSEMLRSVRPSVRLSGAVFFEVDAAAFWWRQRRPKKQFRRQWYLARST
ncbi:hypothetical protein HSBAA_33950 [Vreelandella sulfidaeris]|uniref:Uncharacterized protein n=1 Tax=Vreelandella sulfidaeris TaxID=115553 RepID=A0A455UCB5_9GAMM|nr:hypothetical protein HSBAA_33950 [Halomonas sulfidaeris]